jgi:flagellar L-ring protein precursor FlgH
MKTPLTHGPHAQRLVALVLLGLSLSACNALTRLSQVGEEPQLTSIQNPAVLHNNQPIQMPLPAPVENEQNPNSLWRTGSRHFLKDQRASQVGDIVTVAIEIEDNAEISNTTTRSRSSAEESGLPSFLGFESQLDNFLPQAVDPDSLIDLSASGSSEGAGSVERDEDINLRIAAIVTQLLPNGNLVIAGRQEVRVNYEVRELQVAGVIRPEDITSTNEIQFDQIAEARIAYGGRGQISDLQQPRYGQQIFDVLWPF